MPHWRGGLVLSHGGTRIHMMGPKSSDHAAEHPQAKTEHEMGKNSRWMTWVLEESARTEVTVPWARGTRPNWKARLTDEAPELAKILQKAIVEYPTVLPRQAAL